jgi:succinate dehydrogenase hydrophobic anchor subunit
MLSVGVFLLLPKKQLATKHYSAGVEPNLNEYIKVFVLLFLFILLYHTIEDGLIQNALKDVHVGSRMFGQGKRKSPTCCPMSQLVAQRKV